MNIEIVVFVGYVLLSITLLIIYPLFKINYDKKLKNLDEDITAIWRYLDVRLREGASPSVSASPSPSPEAIDDEYPEDIHYFDLAKIVPPSGSYSPSGFPVHYPTECKYCGWPIGEELICTHCGAPKYRK